MCIKFQLYKVSPYNTVSIVNNIILYVQEFVKKLDLMLNVHTTCFKKEKNTDLNDLHRKGH